MPTSPTCPRAFACFLPSLASLQFMSRSKIRSTSINHVACGKEERIWDLCFVSAGPLIPRHSLVYGALLALPSLEAQPALQAHRRRSQASVHCLVSNHNAFAYCVKRWVSSEGRVGCGWVWDFWTRVGIPQNNVVVKEHYCTQRARPSFMSRSVMCG